MKKRLLSLLLALVLLASFVPIMTQDASAHGSNGIYGNGTGGVYIDIYSNEFVTMSQTSWGQYAYGPQGCAWFATSRQWQLTGNYSVIWDGNSWWNNGNGQLGYPTGRTITAPAIVCYSGHVAIIEAVSGDRALVSEGGRTDFPNNDYCHLGWQSISYVESSSRGFLGYVYLSGAPALNASWEGPSATNITETNAYLSGRANFGQTVTFSQNGVRVYDEAGNKVASKDEWPGTTYSYLNIWYDVTGELGVALQSGKTYKFQFYVIVGGKEYWSPVVTFTTAHTHNYKATVTAPTCTAKGYTTHTCACGDSYVDAYTDALGHAWDSGKVTKQPTATEDGVKTYTCTRCGETKTETIPATGVVDVTKMFTDVSHSWADDGIQYCVTHQLMSGIGNDLFGPKLTTTRAQIVQILYNLEGEPKVSGTTPFTDLTQDWYQDAVLWAYQTGVVAGTSSTTFEPDLPVTREQIAVILMEYMTRVLKLERTWTPADLSIFPDAGSVSDWAKDAMADAVGLGLISGASNGGQTLLEPQGSATREQVATILMEFCKNVKK